MHRELSRAAQTNRQPTVRRRFLFGVGDIGTSVGLLSVVLEEGYESLSIAWHQDVAVVDQGADTHRIKWAKRKTLRLRLSDNSRQQPKEG